MPAHKTHIVHFHNGSGGGVLSVIRNLLAYSINENIVNHIIFTIEKKRCPDFLPPEIKGAASTQIFYHSQENNFYYTCKHLAKLLPDDNAIIVAHDWLELGMASNLGLPNPVVQIIHGDYGYYYELAKKHAHIIDHFITVADSTAKKLQEIIPERKEEIQYLRFPVPGNKWPTKKARDFSIIFIGRGTKEKGYPVLPEIAKALMESGHKVNWHIVGGMDENIQLLFPWPENATIHFHGELHNTEVQKLLVSMHLIILPSLSEGMPVAIIEAMKAGVIPLVNDIDGGVQELIVNEETGFRIPGNSVNGYVEIIKKLINDKSKIANLKDNCIMFANDLFSPSRNTANYEQVFCSFFGKTKKKMPQKKYGSRLDQSWLSNSITTFIRKR